MIDKFRFLPLFLAVCVLAACQVPFASPSYGGGDGLSPQTAVVIQGASDERAGIRAEYAWIAAHFPGAKRQGQRLVSSGGKPQDAIDLVTPSGEHKTVYFDISGFFGKLGY